jgi:hypothetical protein
MVQGIFLHDVGIRLLRVVKVGETKLLGSIIEQSHFLVGKLLRLIRAAGGTHPSPVDVFIIRATYVTNVLV